MPLPRLAPGTVLGLPRAHPGPAPSAGDSGWAGGSGPVSGGGAAEPPPKGGQWGEHGHASAGARVSAPQSSGCPQDARHTPGVTLGVLGGGSQPFPPLPSNSPPAPALPSHPLIHMAEPAAAGTVPRRLTAAMVAPRAAAWPYLPPVAMLAGWQQRAGALAHLFFSHNYPPADDGSATASCHEVVRIYLF